MMEKITLKTSLGEIAVFRYADVPLSTPVIFLHGVYFDHHLWDKQIAAITDRTVMAIDMPLHGESNVNIKNGWNLSDCGDLLLEILDQLKIERVIAIGHSWGSMSIVRAASKDAGRFAGIGLCNMPFKASSGTEKILIRLQHMAMPFRNFYMQQAGKALMGKNSLKMQPELLQILMSSMTKMSGKDIRYTDKAVRIDAEDATRLLRSLKVPSIALVGKEDYAGIPPLERIITVEGGHVSPVEVPDDVNRMIREITGMVK